MTHFAYFVNLNYLLTLSKVFPVWNVMMLNDLRVFIEYLVGLNFSYTREGKWTNFILFLSHVSNLVSSYPAMEQGPGNELWSMNKLLQVATKGKSHITLQAVLEKLIFCLLQGYGTFVFTPLYIFYS